MNLMMLASSVAAQVGAVFVGGVVATETGGSSRKCVCDLTSLTGGTAPAPIQGDVVIAIQGMGIAPSDSDSISYMATAGYTRHYRQRFDDTVTSEDCELFIYSKVMGASVDTQAIGPNVNNSSGGVLICMVFRGLDPEWPIDISALVTATATGALSMDPPAVTSATETAIVGGSIAQYISLAGAPVFTDTNSMTGFLGGSRADSYPAVHYAGVSTKEAGTTDYLPFNQASGSTNGGSIDYAFPLTLNDEADHKITQVNSVVTSTPGRQLSAWSISLASLTDLAENDVLILINNHPSSTTYTSNTAPTDAGWTEVYNNLQDDGSQRHRFSMYWKVMGSTPDTVINMPANSPSGITNGTAHQVYAFRGVDTTTPFSYLQTGAATGATEPSWPSPPINMQNDDGVWFFATGNESTTSYTYTINMNHLFTGNKLRGSGDFSGNLYSRFLRHRLTTDPVEDITYTISSTSASDQNQYIVAELVPSGGGGGITYEGSVTQAVNNGSEWNTSGEGPNVSSVATDVGDLVIMAFTSAAGSHGSSLTLGGGWTFTELHRETGTFTPYYWIGYRFITGSETGNPYITSDTGTTDHYACTAVFSVFRGVTTVDTSAVADAVTGGPNPPSLTSDSALWIATAHFDDENVTLTAPTDYTLADQTAITETPNGISSTCAIAYRIADLASDDPAAWGTGGGNDGWAAATIACS